VFPSAVSPKYSSESPGKAWMHTCLDQYHANKTSSGNGGLKWIEKSSPRRPAKSASTALSRVISRRSAKAGWGARPRDAPRLSARESKPRSTACGHSASSHFGPYGARHSGRPRRRPSATASCLPDLTRAISPGAGLGGSPLIDYGQAITLPAAVASGTSTRRPLFTS
jgi:hypothetical protein